jgi:hypothetical protein
MYNFNELFNGIFNEGSHELETIELAYQLISGTAPTTATQLKAQMIELDQMRIEMVTLYYLLNRKIMQLKDDTQRETDATYVRLVKLGRPSKDAIETELRATNEVYSVNSFKLENYNNAKELVLSFIRSIDARKQTVIELLRTAYRVD